MSSYFNLIDEPWIPCYVKEEESPRLLSLSQVFQDAKKIRTIYTQTPLESIALYRLLLVILHCAVQGPRTKEAWYKLWSNGWENEIVDYLNSKHERFFLFDEKYPFFQAPNLVSKEEDPENGLSYWPITGIAFDKASKDNPTIWDHNTDDQIIGVPLDVAARWIISQQLFNLSGLKGNIKVKDRSSTDSPATRNMHFLIRGRNLFETLMYNLCLYNIDAEKPFVGQSSDDKPCWEQHLKFDSHQKEVLGYLDYMTWQPNWIKLKFNEDAPQKVTKVLVGGGYKFKLPSEEVPWFDPLCMYYRLDKKNSTNKTGWAPFVMKREKSVWRDLNALIPLAEESTNKSGMKFKDIKRPLAIDFLGNLIKNEHECKLPIIKNLPIDIFGISAKSGQNKIYLWRQETYSIPLNFITNPDESETALLIKNFNYSITISEKIEKALIGSLRILIGKDENWGENSDNSGKKNTISNSDYFEENQKLFRNALSVYWSYLSISFQNFIAELIEDRKQAINNWESEIRIAAFKALDFASQGYEESCQALKRVSLAQIMLSKSFKKSGKEGQASGEAIEKSIH